MPQLYNFGRIECIRKSVSILSVIFTRGVLQNVLSLSKNRLACVFSAAARACRAE